MRYHITRDSLRNLREYGVPERLIKRLRKLLYQQFPSQQKLWEAIQHRIGRNKAMRYETALRSQISPYRRPSSSKQPTRSIKYHVYIGVCGVQTLGVILVVLCLVPFFVPEAFRTTIQFSPLWLEFLGKHLWVSLALGGSGLGLTIGMELLRTSLRARWAEELAPVLHPSSRAAIPAEESDEWICPGCHETTETSLSACWYCGRKRD
jgi:hypothetical protein